MKRIVLMIIFCWMILADVFGQRLRVPAFFSDNMVLQRQSMVNIWGWAKAGQKVLVIPSWRKDTLETVVTGDATWRTQVETPPAGGPHTIKFVSQQEHLELKNVMIGEVWVCSGQSNMQWSGANKLKEILDILPSSANPKIRLLQVSNIASQTPQDNIFDSWTVCGPQTLENFSAIGYFFAEKLSRELHVPVGIINASWGGSAAEYWTPKEKVESDEELKTYAAYQKLAPRKPYQPGVLWNSMLAPFAGYTMAGALWYQGEDNTISYAGYDKLIRTMVGAWREAWGYQFPFYFVQIAPHTYSQYKKPNAALLREQQAKTACLLPRSGMVVTTDLVDDLKNIHPTRKKEVASRLADLALAEMYARPLVDYKSPTLKEYKVEGDKISISFSNLEGKLEVRGKEIIDLYIAGKDRKFYPAKFKLQGSELLVFSDQVKEPQAVRFGFTNVSMPNLFNARGLPVAPFRTDNWPDFN
ncbi:sialate O-acetylesterase [Sphingobacterium sp. N143]|uniref:sialate O-acetylesterase n=1 Tax=Sphingobacterium sp. N143 TaxID=2746727 RepID=UPI0025751EC2|nr:sialate O-acetylesterase [Sphingobacterium sp. N143]MDM1294001.1 sialate O-acetylesterase [Sphingobacterium sp. N143]